MPDQLRVRYLAGRLAEGLHLGNLYSVRYSGPQRGIPAACTPPAPLLKCSGELSTSLQYIYITNEHGILLRRAAWNTITTLNDDRSAIMLAVKLGNFSNQRMPRCYGQVLIASRATYRYGRVKCLIRYGCLGRSQVPVSGTKYCFFCPGGGLWGGLSSSTLFVGSALCSIFQEYCVFSQPCLDQCHSNATSPPANVELMRCPRQTSEDK